MSKDLDAWKNMGGNEIYSFCYLKNNGIRPKSFAFEHDPNWISSENIDIFNIVVRNTIYSFFYFQKKKRTEQGIKIRIPYFDKNRMEGGLKSLFSEKKTEWQLKISHLNRFTVEWDIGIFLFEKKAQTE